MADAIFAFTRHDSLFGVTGRAAPLGFTWRSALLTQVPCHLMGGPARPSGQRRDVVVLRFDPWTVRGVQHLDPHPDPVPGIDLDLPPRRGSRARRAGAARRPWCCAGRTRRPPDRPPRRPRRRPRPGTRSGPSSSGSPRSARRARRRPPAPRAADRGTPDSGRPGRSTAAPPHPPRPPARPRSAGARWDSPAGFAPARAPGPAAPPPAIAPAGPPPTAPGAAPRRSASSPRR